MQDCKLYAYLSILTNEKYLKGLSTLYKSFLKTKSSYMFYVVCPDDIDEMILQKLANKGIKHIKVPKIMIPNELLKDNKTKYWNETFFKLTIFNMTMFKKIIYLDSDMLLLKNIDCLFKYPNMSASTGGVYAHPDWLGLNSGIMVIEPSYRQYKAVIECIPEAIKHRKSLGLGYGDQDVLYIYFRDWKNYKELNFGEKFNAIYLWLDDMKAAGVISSIKDVYVIHYIGSTKIWNKTFWENIKSVLIELFHRRFYKGLVCCINDIYNNSIFCQRLLIGRKYDRI